MAPYRHKPLTATLPAFEYIDSHLALPAYAEPFYRVVPQRLARLEGLDGMDGDFSGCHVSYHVQQLKSGKKPNSTRSMAWSSDYCQTKSLGYYVSGEEKSLKLQLLYLEEGTTLFAGYGFGFPVIRWDGAAWQGCQAAGARKDGWAVRLSHREAERCFPGATMATRPDGIPDRLEVSVEDAIRLRPDLFDSYDFPNIRRAPDKEYLERVMPDHIKARIAARKPEKGEG